MDLNLVENFYKTPEDAAKHVSNSGMKVFNKHAICLERTETIPSNQ